MRDKMPILGSEGTKIKDLVEGMYGGNQKILITSTPSGPELGELSSVISDLNSVVQNLPIMNAGEMEKLGQFILDSKIFDPKIKSESDNRRDQIAQKILDKNIDHIELIKDLDKKKERIEKEKARSLKELGQGDSATRKLLQIQEKNPISRIFKTGMFDFKKGISDSIKSAPILGEFDFVKNIADSINPEMQSEKDIERLVEIGKEITDLESAITRAGGENTEKGAILAEELKKFKTEESKILSRTGDPFEQSKELDKIEFEKLSLEVIAQKNVLEEIRDAINKENARGESADKDLLDKLTDQEKSSEEQLKIIENSMKENLKRQQTAEQEDAIAKAKEAAAESPTTAATPSPLKEAKVESPKDGGMFSLDYWFGKKGIFGKNKKVQMARIFFKRTLPRAMGGMLASMTSIIGGIATSIATFFMSIASSLSAFLVPLLPVIGIVAGIALTAYSIYEAFQEMSAVYESTGSIIETLKAGISRFIGTIVGLPFDLLKGIVSYVADWLGFEDFSKQLDSFSFADFFTNIYLNFLGWIEYAVVGIFNLIKMPFVWLNNLIKDTFGIDAFGLYVEYLKSIWNGLTWPFRFLFNLVKWDVILEDILYAWRSLKTTLSDFWVGMKDWVNESWRKLKLDIEFAWTTFKTTFTGLWGGLSTWVSEKWSGLKTTLGEKWDLFKTKFSELWAGLSTWIGESWSALKLSIDEKWKEIKEKFGLSKIFNSIVDKIKNLFNKLKDKMGSFMDLLSGIGIPEMTLYEGGRFINPIKIGPWYPFKGEEEKSKPSVATSNPEGGKKLDQIDKEAEKNGGSFDFLSKMNPFSWWGSSDKDSEQIDMMKESVEKEIARGNLRGASQFLKSMVDVLPPKEFQNIQSKILEAHKNKKLQESAQMSPTMLKQYSFSEIDSKDLQNSMRIGSSGSTNNTNVSSNSSSTTINTIQKTQKTKMFSN